MNCKRNKFKYQRKYSFDPKYYTRRVNFNPRSQRNDSQVEDLKALEEKRRTTSLVMSKLQALTQEDKNKSMKQLLCDGSSTNTNIPQNNVGNDKEKEVKRIAHVPKPVKVPNSEGNQTSCSSTTADKNRVRRDSGLRQEKIKRQILKDLITLPVNNLKEILTDSQSQGYNLCLSLLQKECRVSLSDALRKFADHKLGDESTNSNGPMLTELENLIDADIVVDVCRMPAETIQVLGDILNLDLEGDFSHPKNLNPLNPVQHFFSSDEWSPSVFVKEEIPEPDFAADESMDEYLTNPDIPSQDSNYDNGRVKFTATSTVVRPENLDVNSPTTDFISFLKSSNIVVKNEQIEEPKRIDPISNTDDANTHVSPRSFHQHGCYADLGVNGFANFSIDMPEENLAKDPATDLTIFMKRPNVVVKNEPIEEPERSDHILNISESYVSSRSLQQQECCTDLGANALGIDTLQQESAKGLSPWIGVTSHMGLPEKETAGPEISGEPLGACHESSSVKLVSDNYSNIFGESFVGKEDNGRRVNTDGSVREQGVINIQPKTGKRSYPVAIPSAVKKQRKRLQNQLVGVSNDSIQKNTLFTNVDESTQTETLDERTFGDHYRKPIKNGGGFNDRINKSACDEFKGFVQDVRSLSDGSSLRSIMAEHVANMLDSLYSNVFNVAVGLSDEAFKLVPKVAAALLNSNSGSNEYIGNHKKRKMWNNRNTPQEKHQQSNIIQNSGNVSNEGSRVFENNEVKHKWNKKRSKWANRDTKDKKQNKKNKYWNLKFSRNNNGSNEHIPQNSSFACDTI